MEKKKGRPKGSKDKKPRKSREMPESLKVDGWLPKDENEKRNYVSRILTEVIGAYRQLPCESDEELEFRLDTYFVMCAEKGIRPTVEEMALFCGYFGHKAIQEIESGRKKGFSPATAGLLKKAKGVLQAIDAKMVVDGKLNPVVYFFRAKNYYGLKDNVQEISINIDPLGPAPDMKRLASDYAKRLPDAVITPDAVIAEAVEDE